MIEKVASFPKFFATVVVSASQNSSYALSLRIFEAEYLVFTTIGHELASANIIKVFDLFVLFTGLFRGRLCNAPRVF